MPVPDATAVHGANEIGKETESDHEEGEQQEVHRPVDEATSEWEEEEEGEEDADGGDDLSVDEAFLELC